MEAFLNGAILIEVTLMSFFLALWITWISLRGLFRFLPGTKLAAVPIRASARHTDGQVA